MQQPTLIISNYELSERYRKQEWKIDEQYLMSH